MSRNQRAGLRKAIIQASLQLGSELGEEGLTMRGIAARLGVSATALYQHFDSKAAILREIRMFGTERLLQEVVVAGSESSEDPVECLAAVAENYIMFSRTQPWLYTVLMNSDQPDWTDMSQEERNHMLAPLGVTHRLFTKGLELGKLKPGLDPQMAAIRMWAALHGLCSMLISGRIDENHPAFPVSDQQAFLKNFTDSIIRSFTRQTSA